MVGRLTPADVAVIKSYLFIASRRRASSARRSFDLGLYFFFFCIDGWIVVCAHCGHRGYMIRLIGVSKIFWVENMLALSPLSVTDVSPVIIMAKSAKVVSARRASASVILMFSMNSSSDVIIMLGGHTRVHTLSAAAAIIVRGRVARSSVIRDGPVCVCECVSVWLMYQFNACWVMADLRV
jgi:hypothetical protein